METFADADGHRKLLTDLISRLEDDELKFYESSSTFNFFAWHVCAGAAFVMSILSGALASFMSDVTFKEYGKVVLAVLSFVSAIGGFVHRVWRPLHIRASNLTALMARHAGQKFELQYRVEPDPEVVAMLLSMGIRVLNQAMRALPSFTDLASDKVDAVTAELDRGLMSVNESK
ncbi:hypothetical protein M0D69_35570 [Caballeronia sp. SEWSISQ10-4 2]|uniref:hypothetical protein n=1 Tax=Caballeronia sp. SEWSISQ10-4 2 TaxID=2937438 RepID=UPI0026558C6C|nr:hypothetical protein [Caballeronia sp. SEWSISQ10-4 2]MDN7183243.1 hypothetical protein [Caballeronia sp. SEWSISQ10-4 2]